jgi:hypothetical protein
MRLHFRLNNNYAKKILVKKGIKVQWVRDKGGSVYIYLTFFVVIIILKLSSSFKEAIVTLI